MAAQFKRPVAWVVKGETDPIIRVAFINDSVVDNVGVFYATTADASDTDWTEIGSGSSVPSAVTDPYLEVTHTGAGYTTDYFYRACHRTADISGTDQIYSPWSNVVKSNEETFLFELRDATGHLRGIQFYADTDSSVSGVTWFEAMEIMATEHIRIREFLLRFFTAANIDTMWPVPPPDVVEMVQSRVNIAIIRRSDIGNDTIEERIAIVKTTYREALNRFYTDDLVMLSNGETIEFCGPKFGA